MYFGSKRNLYILVSVNHEHSVMSQFKLPQLEEKLTGRKTKK